MILPITTISHTTYQLVWYCIPTTGVFITGQWNHLSSNMPITRITQEDISVHPYGYVYPIMGSFSFLSNSLPVHCMTLTVIGDSPPAIGYSTMGNLTHYTGF